jgi:hypothetical protein
MPPTFLAGSFVDEPAPPRPQHRDVPTTLVSGSVINR